ncbi:DUF2975 domain-containing protein [Porphyrobacter algicida]|uniref:DUF2975 domain-containing protein n=1 Tax=Qipengyuania algicida TaxID=1836209 RepID=A0A845AJH0_9SPHN|nr:DUF2975 domain-containing protein [Qipengyuania algicida]MXP29005.1 DUF2975 domain-containing protein [Qipengyuania algicida]
MKLNALKLSRYLVIVLYWLNINLAIAFVVALAWFAFSPHWIESVLTLKYGAVRATAALDLIRGALAYGVVTAIPVGMLLGMLFQMIETVREGTPFIAINARRLRLMGWLVLALQLADLVLPWMSIYAHKLSVDWVDSTPNIMGWLIALLLFVLARIFAEGVAMRDDLEGTV